MKHSLIYIILLLISAPAITQENDQKNVRKLIEAYPSSLLKYEDGYVVFKNGSKIQYLESKDRTHNTLINSHNLGDIFAYSYTKGIVTNIKKNQDAGRIRNEEFFKNMYGTDALSVQKKLVSIVWCPNLINQKIRITSINNVDKQLLKISEELDNHPELKDYIKVSGTYYWRKVRGSDRLSSHSYGIALDLDIKHSNFWQWDCRCNDENKPLNYKNRIPQLIVDIFEKHGFIWGGKWYHYDTMHFEYRPELLLD